MQHSNWMFLTRLIIVGRRTFYMRGLYITFVAYWHLGHFEAILNVMCHRKFMNLNHIQCLFFKSSSFSFQPRQKYKAFFHINFNFWFKFGIRNPPFFPIKTEKTHVTKPRCSKLSPLCQRQKCGKWGQIILKFILSMS